VPDPRPVEVAYGQRWRTARGRDRVVTIRGVFKTVDGRLFVDVDQTLATGYTCMLVQTLRRNYRLEPPTA
jgi:hypothetical protein